MKTTPNISFSHEIYLAKNKDYLVYKLTSEPRLYTIGLCDRQFIFNATTFQCTPCPPALKSFGLQVPECMPCIDLYYQTSRDDFAFAKYDHMCTEG